MCIEKKTDNYNVNESNTRGKLKVIIICQF